MNLRRLNTLEEDPAAAALRDCCGATAWVTGMLTGRPFKDTTSLLTKAEEVWWDLSAEDWQEAFSAEGAEQPPDAALQSLAEEYSATFGYPFITASTASSEMEAECRRRLGNDPLAELGIAATEMARIANRRLRRLLDLA